MDLSKYRHLINERSVPCNRDTPCCAKQDYMPSCCLSNLSLMLKDMATIFAKNNFHYWLDWGALLGLVRENKLLVHDHDLDIGIFVEDLPKLKRLVPEIEALGYCWFGGYPLAKRLPPPRNCRWPRIFFSKTNYLMCDVFLWQAIDNNYVNLVYYGEGTKIHQCPRQFYEKLESFHFNGVGVKIPCYTDKYLEMRYGPMWQTPDPFFYRNGGREIRTQHALEMDYSFLKGDL